MALYYAYGIFSGEAKPHTITEAAKHNPLQRLAYFGFKVMIAPALWLSGLLPMFYASRKDTALGAALPLQYVAWLHFGAAFALLILLVAHVFISATMGHSWYSQLRAMVTGYENLEEPRQTP
jgi:thiosulfate reductase cytochrome b subunit